MLTKSVPVTHVKAGAADGLPVGQFEALVSVMGVKDSNGDVVMPGAFDESLAEWAASDNPIPIIWSHGYYDVGNHIGYVLDAAEKTIDGKTGLWVQGQLDTGDGPEDAQARKAAALLRGKRVTQFSFSYDVIEESSGRNDQIGEFNELRKLKLYEVGPTLIGANQETELLSAKAFAAIAAEVKAGRVISAKNEALLRAAHDSIATVLAALDSNDGKASTAPPANDETPPGKSEEPTESVTADALALDLLDLDLLETGI